MQVFLQISEIDCEYSKKQFHLLYFMIMASKDNRKAAIKKLKLLVFNSKSNVSSFRKKIEDSFYEPILPNRVERQERNYGGINCDVLVPEIYSSKRIMLYIHGGCFVAGSRSSYRSFCSVLANKAYSRTVVPEFRLAPTYAFPAAIEDLQACFRALFTEEQIACSLDSSIDENGEKQNIQPEVIIAADGSGASQALSLVLSLRERYRVCIKKIVLFSPWLNLSSNSALISGKKVCDEVMSGECLLRSGDVYTYASNLENPLVSPIFASRELLTGFPPVYIQMGEKEILLEEAKEFCKKVKDAGSECELDAWPDMMNFFQFADEYLDASHRAFDKFSAVISGIDNETSVGKSYENKPVLEHSMRADA